MNQKKTALRPKKSLGQNYLIDENICRNIIDSFNVEKNDIIIEIGSGKGEITKYLITKCDNVFAIEIDKNNSSFLKTKFPGINIQNKDFLKIDLNDILNANEKTSSIAKSFEGSKIRIIGNIPYNITTDILFKLIDNRKLIKDSQLMIQEEVAQRIVAKPGSKTYGILSVMIQVFCEPKLLFKVSQNCFYPKPKVDSRIVHFDFNTNLLESISDIYFFRKFVGHG